MMNNKSYIESLLSRMTADQRTEYEVTLNSLRRTLKPVFDGEENAPVLMAWTTVSHELNDIIKPNKH